GRTLGSPQHMKSIVGARAALRPLRFFFQSLSIIDGDIDEGPRSASLRVMSALRSAFSVLETEAKPESGMPVIIAAIWVAIIASIIRPVVVLIIVPSAIVPPIRISIVTTISVARIPPTPLRQITVCAALRVYRSSKRRRHRERQDAH